MEWSLINSRIWSQSKALHECQNIGVLFFYIFEALLDFLVSVLAYVIFCTRPFVLFALSFDVDNSCSGILLIFNHSKAYYMDRS